jgi:hypothetical protein
MERIVWSRGSLCGLAGCVSEDVWGCRIGRRSCTDGMVGHNQFTKDRSFCFDLTCNHDKWVSSWCPCGMIAALHSSEGGGLKQ